MNPERIMPCDPRKLQPLKFALGGPTSYLTHCGPKRKLEAWVTKRFPFASAPGLAIQLATSDAAGAKGTGMTG